LVHPSSPVPHTFAPAGGDTHQAYANMSKEQLVPPEERPSSRNKKMLAPLCTLTQQQIVIGCADMTVWTIPFESNKGKR